MCSYGEPRAGSVVGTVGGGRRLGGDTSDLELLYDVSVVAQCLHVHELVHQDDDFSLCEWDD